jgi:hypothetical protein
MGRMCVAGHQDFGCKELGECGFKWGRMCVAGHQDFGFKELEECGFKWGRMAGNSEEGQGPQRAVAPMMMMMMIMYNIREVPSVRVTKRRKTYKPT